MDERERGHNAYYSMRGAGWDAVGVEDREALRALIPLLTAAVRSQETSAPSPTPVEVGLQLHEAATRLLAAVAGEERDLRQVITTLRTALAVCWDMYSFPETGRVSVHEHMERLKAQIEELESDLLALRDASAEPD